MIVDRWEFGAAGGRRALAAVCLAAVLGAGACSVEALAAGRQAKTGPGVEISVTDLDAAKTAGQLILVVGEGASSQRAEVSFYQKEDDGRWREEFSVDGFVGRNGTSADKREGDEKTPTGNYGFTMAFGVREDPGSRLPYHLVDEDDYWVDDGDSAYYNLLVNTREVKKDWDSAEHLMSIVPFYDYALALDYNGERTPGKGSAVFLHCMENDAVVGTGGCVKIPEERMKQLVQQVDEGCRVIIVSQRGDLSQY